MAESCVSEQCISEPVDQNCTFATGLSSTTQVFKNCTSAQGDSLTGIIDSGECSCCNDDIKATLQTDNDPLCPKIGDVFTWVLDGCNCPGLCGPIEWSWGTTGSNPAVSLVYSDPAYANQTTITVGPVKNKQISKFKLCCSDLEDACELPDDIIETIAAAVDLRISKLLANDVAIKAGQSTVTLIPQASVEKSVFNQVDTSISGLTFGANELK